MPHKNLIYSICIKYTFNQEDIEDNYIEALANFFKYMDSYDPARPVKTWIYAVTKRLVADLNTRNRSRTPADDNAQIGELLDTARRGRADGELHGHGQLPGVLQ